MLAFPNAIDAMEYSLTNLELMSLFFDVKQKWTKGKAKDKVENAVFLERKAMDSIVNNPSKVGKVLTVSTFVEKNKVNG